MLNKVPASLTMIQAATTWKRLKARPVCGIGTALYYKLNINARDESLNRPKSSLKQTTRSYPSSRYRCLVDLHASHVTISADLGEAIARGLWQTATRIHRGATRMRLGYDIYPDLGLLPGRITQPERIRALLAWLRDPQYERCTHALMDFAGTVSPPRESATCVSCSRSSRNTCNAVTFRSPFGVQIDGAN
jgi:hypothetical protein